MVPSSSVAEDSSDVEASDEVEASEEAEDVLSALEVSLLPEQPAKAVTTIAAARAIASSFFVVFISYFNSLKIDICVTVFHGKHRIKMCAGDYPLTAPTTIPLTKYFCRNGYRMMIGPMVITEVAILKLSFGGFTLTVAPAVSLLSAVI